MGYDQMMQYFNIGIIVILIFGAIGGFWFGLFKSLYNFCVFFGLLLIGWFISPIIINFILSYDISSLYPLEYEGVTITNLKESIPLLFGKIVPELDGMLVEGTKAYALVFSFANMALRLVFLIVWLILMSTVFKFFFWIIYLIIKPRRKDASGKRKKKGFISRLSGMGIGLVHNVLLIVLLSIPIGGLCSIGSSIGSLIETPALQEQSYQLLFKNEGVTFSRTTALDQTTEEALRFMNDYRNTVSGKIGGFVKIGETPIDVVLFDEIFSMKVEDDKLQIRKEFETALKIYSKIETETDGNFSLDAIALIDPIILSEIVEELSTLKLFSVAIPVGFEYVDASGNFSEYTADIDLESIMTKLEEIDFQTEIQLLGGTFVDVLKLNLLSNTDINYFGLDTTVVNDIFTNLGSSEIIKLAADIAVPYLLDNEGVATALTSLGISKDDLVMSDVNWLDEITNFGKIYEAMTSLNITKGQDGKYVIGEMTEQAINTLSTAIYDSKFLSNNTTLIAQTLATNYLPAEYQGLININEVTLEDFTSVLSLAMVVYNSGALETDFDPMSLLTTENIEKIARYLSNSQLISDNISGVLGLLLEQAGLPFDVSLPPDMILTGDEGYNEYVSLFSAAKEIVELGIGTTEFATNFTALKADTIANAITSSKILMHNVDGIVEYALSQNLANGIEIIVPEIDWESQAGKDELKALLNATSALVQSDIITTQSFDSLTPDIIERLALSLSQSTIIKDNLSNLLDTVIVGANLGFDINVDMEPNDWTYAELHSLISSMKIIMSKTNIPEDLFTISETEIDTFLASNLITNAIISLLRTYTQVDGTFYDLVIIDRIDDINYFWRDQYDIDNNRIDGEIRKLINSAFVIFGETPNFSDPASLVNIERIINLTDTDIDKLLDSVILKDSIVNQIVKLGEGTESILVVNMIETDPNWGNEIKAFIKAAKLVLGENPDLANFDPNVILTLSTGDLDPADDDVGTILESVIIKDTIINQIIKLGQPSGTTEAILIVDETKISDWKLEIKTFIRAAKILLGETIDLSNISFDPNMILNLSTGDLDPADDDVGTILESVILKDTIVNQIIKLGQPSGTTEAILVINQGKITDWGIEIKTFIRAAKILLGDPIDLNNITFNPNMILNLSTGDLDPADDDVKTILESIILEDTIVNEIKKLGNTGTSSSVLVINESKITNWETEIKAFIRSAKILLGETVDLSSLNFDANVVLGLSTGDLDPADDDVKTILESVILADTIVKMIIDLGSPNGTIPSVLVVNYTMEDSIWLDTETETGEIKRLIRAVKLLVGTNNITDPASITMDKMLDLSQTQIDTIVSSKILSETAVQKIEDLVIPETGALYNVLFMPAGEIDYYGSNGELKRFIIAVQFLVNDNTIEGQGISDMKEISIASLTNENQSTILSSLIIKETIISQVEKAAVPGSIIKIHPTLQRGTITYVEGSWDTELPLMLNSIKVFIGTGNLSNMSIDENLLLNISDPNINLLVSSKVLSYSLSKKIEEEGSTSTSFISLPRALNPTYINDYNEELWYGITGELVKVLRAIRELGLANFETSISVDTFFDDLKQPILLDSKVIEASVVKQIDKQMSVGQSLYNKLVYPTVWSEDDWYGETGELRKFLTSIEIIVGTGTFENASFGVDKFFGEDQATLLDSRLVEASVINQIDLQMSVGNSLYNKLVYPNVWSEDDWYGETGELVRFLASIEIIIGTGTFETATFEVDKFLGPDQTILLDSRLVEASAIRFIQSDAKLTIPSVEATYYYLSDQPIVWERTYLAGTLIDDGELRKFLNGVSELKGTSTFASLEFNMETMLLTDFNKVLPSRILEATVADMITTLITTGALSGFIGEPMPGYQWYFHSSSTAIDEGYIRRGEYTLPDMATVQVSDLYGFLKAIQEMDKAGLNFNSITMQSIINCDSTVLANALWDYSRVMQSSIHIMLNHVMDISITNPTYRALAGNFNEFETKAEVIAALDLMDTYLAYMS